MFYNRTMQTNRKNRTIDTWRGPFLSEEEETFHVRAWNATYVVARDLNIVRVGEAITAPGDSFNKKLGRKIATGRALHQYKVPHSWTLRFNSEEEACGYMDEIRRAYKAHLQAPDHLGLGTLSRLESLLLD